MFPLFDGVTRLAMEWDNRIRVELLRGRSPQQIAMKYGLYVETVESFLRNPEQKGKAA